MLFIRIICYVASAYMLNEQLSYSVDHQQYFISINSSNKVIEAGVIQKDDIIRIYSVTIHKEEAATVIVLYRLLRVCLQYQPQVRIYSLTLLTCCWPTRLETGAISFPKITLSNIIEATTPMPKDIEGFLKNSENKVNLNLMIAKHAVHPLRSGNNKAVITYKEL